MLSPFYVIKGIEGPERTRILKNDLGGGRRTLLPPDLQRHVVFRAAQEVNSDSSSDAWAFEVMFGIPSLHHGHHYMKKPAIVVNVQSQN